MAMLKIHTDTKRQAEIEQLTYAMRAQGITHEAACRTVWSYTRRLKMRGRDRLYDVAWRASRNYDTHMRGDA